MLKISVLFFMGITVLFAVEMPPVRLDFTQKVFFSFKSLKPAAITKFVTDFNKGTTPKLQFAALQQLEKGASAAEKPKVHAVVMEFMDYRQAIQSIKGVAHDVFGKALTPAIDTKLNTHVLKDDAKYKGDISMNMGSLLKYMQTLLPPAKYAKQYKALSDAMAKHRFDLVQAFTHWNGKDTSIYFLKPGYKRTPQPWEKQVK